MAPKTIFCLMSRSWSSGPAGNGTISSVVKWNISSVRCCVCVYWGKKSSLIQLDRCFPVTPALFTAVATVFVRLSSSSEHTELHPGALFPPGEPLLVRQVICCLLPLCFWPALFSPQATALATNCKGWAAASHTKVLACRARVRSTALKGFTRSTLIAGLAAHLTSQGHGPTTETFLTAHYG